MKQFLYLDKDLVGSIVAQAEKGLITEISNETEELKGNTSKNVGQVETNGKIGGNIWKLVKAEAALNIEGEIEKEKVNNFATKEMVVKTMHDAAFDIAYDYIKPIYVIDDEVYTYGDYIEVNRKFEFVDMQYLEGLFSKDGLIDFLKKSAKEEAHGIAGRLGLKRPIMYDLGYPNNNCIGCPKGRMGYWNKIRVDFPEVFERRARQEREIGHSCINGVFLDELEPDRGNINTEIMEDCTIACQLLTWGK